jgi:hypothetical protein
MAEEPNAPWTQVCPEGAPPVRNGGKRKMATNKVDDLLRRYDDLNGLSGAEFVRGCRRLLEFIITDPEAYSVGSKLIEQAARLIVDWQKADADLRQRVATLRDRYVELGPIHPEPPVPALRGSVIDRTLSTFSALEKREETLRLMIGRSPDLTTGDRMLEILRFRVQTDVRCDAGGNILEEPKYPSKDWEDLEREILQLVSSRDRERKYFSDRAREAPGLHLAHWSKGMLTGGKNTWGEVFASRSGVHADLWRALSNNTSPYEDPLDDELLYKSGLVESEKKKLEEFCSKIKRSLPIIIREMRELYGTRTSLVWLVDRYRNRCEWHDRKRLFRLIDGESNVEDVLRDEFATWLFDNGWSPLVDVKMAGLRPDIMLPGLYVEAKQYSKNGSAKKTLIDAVKQVRNTVPRLQGETGFSVEEAVLLIFRAGGEMLIPPMELGCEGYRLIIRVVDVAPGAASGSQGKPDVVQVTVEELLELTAPKDESKRGPSPARTGKQRGNARVARRVR